MKGLLLKDLSILMCQKRFYGVMLLFCVLYSYMLEDSSFVIGYIILMCSMMTLNSLAYDEHDNGNAFLFTMPFTRAEYVKSKYVFGILSIAASATVSIVICCMITFIKIGVIEKEAIITAFITSLIGIMFMSINLPVHIKFGPEKGKMVVVVIGIGMFALLTLVPKTLSSGEMALIAPYMERITIAMICGVMMILTVIVVAISMKFAVKAIEKKEF